MTRRNLYVGTYTAASQYIPGTPSDGIEHLAFDDDTGALEHLETTTGIASPQYLARHPTLPVLYAGEFAAPGSLVAYSVGQDGTLEHRSTTGSLGDLAVAVSVHPTGSYAYVANWRGTLTQFRLAPDGGVGPAEPIPQRDTFRINTPLEGESPRPHQIRPTPSGNGVLVPYHGADELSAYVADADGRLSSLPAATIEFESGSATRHVEFHPSGRWVYVVGEWDSTLHVLEADEGIPIRIASAHPTTPDGFTDKNRTSELVLHPDGHALYVGNRGADCVTVYALDDSGAGVEAIGYQPTMGQGPRCLTVDATGRFLLVGNAISDETVVFAIDDERRLRPTGISVRTNSPSSLVFAS